MNLGPIVNSAGGELGQDISADGSVLWFSRGWPEGTPTDEDIYYAIKVEGHWTEPVPWELNTPFLEDNPNVSADGLRLYFTAIYETIYGGGYGSFDVWVSEKVGGLWQSPVNLGPGVNTAYHDANPSISADDRIMYFTSNRPGAYGGFDLYSSIREAPTSVGESGLVIPGSLWLGLGPNPSNLFYSGTTIAYRLPAGATVRLGGSSGFRVGDSIG